MCQVGLWVGQGGVQVTPHTGNNAGVRTQTGRPPSQRLECPPLPQEDHC